MSEDQTPVLCAAGCGFAADDHHVLHRGRRPDVPERDHPKLPLCRRLHDDHHLSVITISLLDRTTGEIVDEPLEERHEYQVVIERGDIRSLVPLKPRDLGPLGDGVVEAFLTVLPEFLIWASTEKLVETFREASRVGAALGLYERGICWALRCRFEAVNQEGWSKEAARLLGRKVDYVVKMAHTYEILFGRCSRQPVEVEGLQLSVLDECAEKADPDAALTVALDNLGAPRSVIRQAIGAGTDTSPETCPDGHDWRCRRCGARHGD